MRGRVWEGEREKMPRLASRRGLKKGALPPLYLEGLKWAWFRISSIHLFLICKFLHIYERGKSDKNAKKRGSHPEKSGGNPAYMVWFALLSLDIYGKTVSRIWLQKARKPAWNLRKMAWHLFCHAIMGLCYKKDTLLQECFFYFWFLNHICLFQNSISFH